jgi:very-short-patch-repair endonuclease
VGTVNRPSDADLARRAGNLRILTIEDLRAAGLTPEAIEHRVRQGRLQRLWRGVYLVGPAPPAPLSLAHGAASSFTGAAYVSNDWGTFVHGFAPPPELPVDVLVVSGTRSARRNVRIHRARALAPRDVGVCQGVPVTSAARAILDCAETATVPQVERLIADAQVAKAVTIAQLEDVLDRAGRRRAATRLRAALSDSTGMTLSEAERILRRLLKAANLPQPITNHPVGPYKADFAWPDYKLIIEFDSYAHHGHKIAFHHDRRRNSELTAKGWSVMPVSWDQLENEPLAVIARVAEALTARTSARSRRA